MLLEVDGQVAVATEAVQPQDGRLLHVPENGLPGDLTDELWWAEIHHREAVLVPDGGVRPASDETVRQLEVAVANGDMERSLAAVILSIERAAILREPHCQL
jgi:hypothetical protein